MIKSSSIDVGPVHTAKITNLFVVSSYYSVTACMGPRTVVGLNPL